MHLRNFPHVYVKDGERRLAYYSVEARELREAGYVKEEKAPEAIEPVAEVPEVDPDDAGDFEPEPIVGDIDFEAMTKKELLQYAMDRGVDLPDNDLKAELIEACRAL